MQTPGVARVLSLFWLVLASGVGHPAPVELVSRVKDAGIAAAGDSTAPVLSGDGRYAVFLSSAENLVTNDHNGLVDAFVRDLASRETRLVSVAAGGDSGNGACLEAGISSNGQLVVFVSRASDLAAGDTNGLPDVFVRDLVGGTTRLVSVATNGCSGSGESGGPSVSADGRWIVFESRARDLVSGDTNNVLDVFLYESEARTISRLSGKSPMPQLATRAWLASGRPLVSAVAGSVLFSSQALNLAPGIAAGGLVHTNRLYYRRPLSGTNAMVNLFPSDLVPQTVITITPLAYDLSANGRYAVLQALPSPSSATNAVARGVHWVDLEAGLSAVVGTNLTTAYVATWPELSGPLLSADGETVVFEARESSGSGLTRPVVYAWSVASRESTRVSSGGFVDDPNTDPPGPVESPFGELLGASRDGDFVAFLGGSTNDPAAPQPAQQLVVRRRSTGELRRVTRTLSGGPVADAGFSAVSFSADGMRLAFQCGSGEMVAGDWNEASDVFVYDWQADAVELVSERVGLRESVTAPRAAVVGPEAFSADGRYLVYTSLDGRLAANDTNGAPDVFVYDLQTGSNVLVSVNFQGTGPAKLGSGKPVISGDGRWVAFTSGASDLVVGMSNGVENVFVRDLTGATTLLVSHRAVPDPSPGLPSTRPAISRDGRWVAFQSTSSQLAPPLDGTLPDVFLFERASGNVSLVSSNTAGTASESGPSVAPTFTPDGRWVVFASRETDLTEPVLSTGWRVFGHEIATGLTRALSVDNPVAAVGTAIPAPWIVNPAGAISTDSRWVAFVREISLPTRRLEIALHDLSTGDTTNLMTGAASPSVSADGRLVAWETRPVSTGIRQIEVLDRQTGEVTIASRSAGTAAGANGNSYAPILSPDGRFVVFTSQATDLVPANDANQRTDVFVYDRIRDVMLLVSVGANGLAGNGVSSGPVLGPDGRTLVFASFAGDLVEGDLNRDQDLFIARLPGPESEFRIVTITPPGLGGAVLVWVAEEGKSYRLDWTEDAGKPAWQALNAEVTVTGGQATAVDDTALGVARRFYRVVEIP